MQLIAAKVPVGKYEVFQVYDTIMLFTEVEWLSLQNIDTGR